MAHAFDKRKKTRFPVRLQKAIKDSHKMTSDMRENRLAILERYASGWYDPKVGSSRRPLNMVYRYITTMVPFLVSRNPRFMCEASNNGELSGFANTFQLALNHLIQEIDFRDTLRSVVRDSLVGVGIVKTGMTPNGTIDIGGHTYQQGQPYSQTVDFDDYVFDIVAQSQKDVKFQGNRYRLPLDFVRESGLFKNFDKLDSSMPMYGDDNFNPKKISDSDVSNTDYSELYDYVELYDIYLPDEGIMVTLPSEGQGDKYLRVTDEMPEEGCFDILQYHEFPNSCIGIPPCYAIMDMDEQLNQLIRRMQRSMTREKSILAYEGGATKDAERVVGAQDGEAVRVEHIDMIKEVTFGGTDGRALDFATWIRSQVSDQGGNLDTVGGLKDESGTLGQSQMIQQNAGRVIEDMVGQVHNFGQSIGKKLAWYLFHDPLIKIPVVKEMKHWEPLRVVYDEDTKEGDWVDFNFEIEPYSMQSSTPEEGYQKLLTFVNQVVLPVLPILQANGTQLNAMEYLKQGAQYAGIKNIEKWLDDGMPPMETAEMGAYQPMQGQATPKPKAGGGDNRTGGANQQSNSNQANAKNK